MARSKKSEEKSTDSASLQISIEDFIRTRDSVVTGLATLQSAVQDLSRAYIAHTNTVIGKAPGSSLELLSLTNPLSGDNVFFGGRMATPGANVDTGEGKKRKRAPHDKNAPKRPVTPYFLYMQTARSLIAAEMEPGHSAKEVADEGTKRWNEMPPEDREFWSYKYGVNFARYKEKVKAYKAGLPIPEISDVEAKKLYEEQKKVGITYESLQDDHGHVEGHIDTETSEADAFSSDDESPEPPKVPSPPKSPRTSKRRIGFKDAKDKKSSLIKQMAVASPEADQTPKSSEKDKRKKSVKKRDTKDTGESLESKKEIVIPIPNSPKVMSQDTLAKQRKSKKMRRSGAIAD